MTVSSFPKTADEFKTFRDQTATTPQGGALVFAVALNVYGSDAKLGAQFLTLCLDMDRLTDGEEGVSGKQPSGLRDFKDRNGAKPHIARSMFAGTKPENGYELPAFPLQLTFQDRPETIKDTEAKVFIVTSGADTPKPLQLRKNDKGIWKANEWSSFQGNCRQPGEQKKIDSL